MIIVSNPIHGIDKFIVPSDSRDEFLGKIHETHIVLRKLPGFVSDFVVEQIGGPGEFNLVTTVIGENKVAIDGAKKAMHAHHSSKGFDPGEYWQRVGIMAGVANYKKLDV